MKIEDILNDYSNNFIDWETYEYTDKTQRLHTDFIKSIDLNSTDDIDNFDVFLLNEEEYNNTILANSCVQANFNEWYGDLANFQNVLVIVKK